jgi:hypothetical protein
VRHSLIRVGELTRPGPWGFTHEQDVPAWLNLQLFEATEAVKVDA